MKTQVEKKTEAHTKHTFVTLGCFCSFLKRYLRTILDRASDCFARKEEEYRRRV